MVMLPWNVIEKKIFQIIKFSKCKYIFSEKPIALSEEKLIKIIHYVNLRKKKLYVLYNRRSYSIFNYIKKLLKKHKLKKFSMQISEKKQALIKRHTKKMLGNIRYHLTSHWIDLVMWLLNIYKFELKKINKSYQLISIKNHKININYFGNRPINMDLEFAGFKLKVLTLEKLYLIKKGKRKLILNEYKVNKFKPGIMLASKNIKRYVSLKKKNNLIPNINELKNLYQSLNLLEI